MLCLDPAGSTTCGSKRSPSGPDASPRYTRALCWWMARGHPLRSRFCIRMSTVTSTPTRRCWKWWRMGCRRCPVCGGSIPAAWPESSQRCWSDSSTCTRRHPTWTGSVPTSTLAAMASLWWSSRRQCGRGYRRPCWWRASWRGSRCYSGRPSCRKMLRCGRRCATPASTPSARCSSCTTLCTATCTQATSSSPLVPTAARSSPSWTRASWLSTLILTMGCSSTFSDTSSTTKVTRAAG
mmetsp:Transcript_29462/g.95048  ORF Transcript_29462/g.95048 Transcript_29462/m.95048 type:complete len:238 (-) Transcript_29462:466-1179(-)